MVNAFKHMGLGVLITLGFSPFCEAKQVKVTKEALKLFDDTFVSSEEEACLKSALTPKSYRDWLVGEIKKTTDSDALMGTTTGQIWDRDLISFKIDGVFTESKWEPKSPGIFGKINGAKINFSNVEDGKTLKAQVIDVAEGVSTDLKDRTDLENKIWLVKQSDLIPSVVALSMEAKLHKALGLIIYGEDNANLDTPGTLAALPIVRVSENIGQELKKQIKEKDVSVEMSSRADFPKDKTQDWVAVKKGSRDIRLAVTADYGDCKDVALLLGLLDWVKKTSQDVQGTIFGFVSGDEKGLGPIASEIKIDATLFKAQKFLVDWLRSDQDLADLIDGKTILKRALQDASNFSGLVDKEVLNQYKTELKKLETVVKDKPEIAFQLKNIYQSDALSDLALDLKSLRQVHQFAERGQWAKAIDQFQKISDYDWASNVSSPIFIEYSKSLSQADLRVNPALWGQLQQGRGHLDGFIEAVEVEIDRLDKLLTDNFFKINKSIENLDKI